jgi:hypothetical protein
MRSRLLLVLALLFAAFVLLSGQDRALASPDAAAAPPPPRMVITWVPPYNLLVTRQRLRATYGDVGPRNGLTHLALQFWVPAADGGLARASSAGAISDETVREYVAWAHANGLKVLLCVYNGDGADWDWDLAKNAFITNRGTFISELIAEMQAFDLDGIDVDLEGPDTLFPDVDDDKAAYVRFITLLADRVHARGKVITLDSFPWKFNGPNWTWWSALFPHVDAINSMGYAEIGRNATGWARYSTQLAHAGAHAAKLNIGMPSHLNNWQGNAAANQVRWMTLAVAGRSGVAIWDAQNQAAVWRGQELWQLLREIRED